MKILSLFSGIGAFEKALDNLGVEYELVNYCEIDKYASKSYAAIHNVDESLNLGDITKVNEKELPKDIDLCCYGFPCQDISISGKMRGLFNEDGSQTRSGLFFDALRIIEETQPRVAIAENVKNLTSKKFSEQFKIVLDSLEKAGYNNSFKVLNSRDFGIPQNRERVFIVSIRKDIDNGNFEFPQGFPLEMKLQDIVEENVGDEYFLTEQQIESIAHWKAQQKPFKRVLGKNSVCHTLTARGAGEYHSGMILYSEGLEDTTNIHEECLYIKEATKKGYAEAYVGDSVNYAYLNSKTRRGRVGHQIAQTLTTSPQQGIVTEMLEIRTLTEKEAFRLTGFTDIDFEKAQSVCSKRNLYKQAGNSIVVPVVEHIITTLLDCGALTKGNENQIKFNNEESFNEVVKNCQKGC